MGRRKGRQNRRKERRENRKNRRADRLEGRADRLRSLAEFEDEDQSLVETEGPFIPFIRPAAGSPDGCHCSFVPLQGEYSAGPVVRCDNCLEVRLVTEQNSCPDGWKIFSPRSQADWEVLHATLGDHAHHIADPARTPGFTTNWPASPWLIVDVSKGSGGRSPSTPLTMNSDSPDATE